MSYFSLSMCTMCVIFWIIPKFWFTDKKGNVKSDADFQMVVVPLCLF